MEQPPDTKPYTELTISELAGIMAMSIIATNQDPDERFRASEAIAVTLKRKMDALIIRDNEGK